MPGPNWLPPASLRGRHWRVELRHACGDWRTYTEHRTEHDALVFCDYKQEFYPCDSWRVTEIVA